MIPEKSNHVVTVDFARGAMAASVMLYHLLGWESIVVVERVGYYAVYGFFIVSGFSLYIAYRDRLGSASEIRTFFVRRFFRIAPLFYTALVLHWWIVGTTTKSLFFLLANVSFTFGLTNPGETSLLTGGWSIGIEMVFYLVFPIIVACCGRSISILGVITVAAAVLQIMFVNHVLADHDTLTGVWSAYTQPISFSAYFLLGCLVGEFYSRRPDLKGSYIAVAMTIAALVVFSVLPVETSAKLLAGYKGVILACACCLFVAAVAFIKEPSGRLRSFAVWFGSLSYPIYLLHPLVLTKLSEFQVPSSTWRILLTIAFTVGLAHVVSRRIEIPLRNYGRRLAA